MSLEEYVPKRPESTMSTVLWRYRYAEAKKHERKPGVVWLTDLVSCSLKRRFEETYPEISEADPFNPVTLEGDIVHAGVEKILSDIFGDSFQAEVEREKKLGDITVRGRIDGIIDKVYGVEIKSTKGDFGLPHEHHILQANLERWLFDLAEVEILYVSRDRVCSFVVGDKPRFEGYIVQDRLTDEDVLKMVANGDAPKYSWQCKWCSYNFVCPKKVVG